MRTFIKTCIIIMLALLCFVCGMNLATSQSIWWKIITQVVIVMSFIIAFCLIYEKELNERQK